MRQDSHRIDGGHEGVPVANAEAKSNDFCMARSRVTHLLQPSLSRQYPNKGVDEGVTSNLWGSSPFCLQFTRSADLVRAWRSLTIRSTLATRRRHPQSDESHESLFGW
jgi:hypothetical protein